MNDPKPPEGCGRIGHLDENNLPDAVIEASNPRTAAQRLRVLAGQGPALSELVAANPNAPLELLFELAEQHPVAFMGNPVLELLELENPEGLAFLPWPAWQSLARVPNLGLSWLRTIHRHTGSKLDRLLAVQSNTPTEMLESFFVGPPPEDRDGERHYRDLLQTVIRHPNASSRLLVEAICQIPYISGEDIIDHPNAPTQLLDTHCKLQANDPNIAPEQLGVYYVAFRHGLEAMLRYPFAPGELFSSRLETGLRYPNWSLPFETLRRVINHSNVLERDLKALLEHHDAKVRDAAARRLAARMATQEQSVLA